jgi:succinate dehydrogenase/fumarate reductase cytochrome b subunit
MKYVPIYALLLLSPLTYTHAQEGSLQGLITGIGGFINDVLIPLILGLAFLIFLINAVRFFVIGGDNTESQENARSLALYGIGAFVLILSLWGLINLLSDGFGLNEGPCINGETVQSDYIDRSAPCSSPRPQPRPTNLNTNAPYVAPEA